MNKNKTDDKILKDLVEKLKKEEKPSWKELEKQGSWEVSCTAEDIWGKKKKNK